MLQVVESVLDCVWLQTKVVAAVAPKLFHFMKKFLSTRNYNVIETSFALWENDHLVTVGTRKVLVLREAAAVTALLSQSQCVSLVFVQAIWEAHNKPAMLALKDALRALGKDDVWSQEVRYNSAGVLELLEDLSTMGL